MFKTRTLLGMVPILGMAFLTLTSCGAATTASKENPVVHIIDAGMIQKVDITTVHPGKVTFMVTNNDNVMHEAVLMKTDTAPNSLNMMGGADSKMNEDTSGVHVGEVEVEAGATGTVTLDLTAGKYVLVCNEIDHYKAGMYTAFEVK